MTQGNGLVTTFYKTMEKLLKVVNRIGPINSILGLTILASNFKTALSSIDSFNSKEEYIEYCIFFKAD